MTRRTAGTAPARYSNDFEPAAAAIPLDSVLSTGEVAVLVGLSQHAISALCADRLLQAQRIGGRWYIGRSQVERLIRQRRGAES